MVLRIKPALWKTLILHRISLPQMRDAKGAAVYAYCNPFATKQMRQNHATVFSGEHQRFCKMPS